MNIAEIQPASSQSSQVVNRANNRSTTHKLAPIIAGTWLL